MVETGVEGVHIGIEDKGVGGAALPVEKSSPLGRGGLPDETSQAQSVGQRSHDFVHLPLAVLVFDHHDGTAVAGGQVGEIAAQVVERAVPSGVVGLADDVEDHVLGNHAVEESHRLLVLAAAGGVQHDFDVGVGGADRGARHAQQDGQREVGTVVDGSRRPEHAVVYLIAHLHHVGGDALGDEAFDGLPRVVVDLAFEPGAVHAFPGCGFDLLLGVGPVVAVMEVEQEFHARLFDALGHGQRVLQVAEALFRVADGRGGVHEQAQANPVEPVVGEDVHHLTRPLPVGERGSALLLLVHPRDVGADDRLAEIDRTAIDGRVAGLRGRVGIALRNLFVDGYHVGGAALGNQVAVGGLPEHGADAQPAGDGAHDVVYLGDVGTGVFADRKGQPVAGGQVVQIGLQVVERAVRLVVIGESDDIEPGSALNHVVEEAAAEGVLSAQGQMEHDSRVGEHLLHGRLSGLVEIAESVPPLGVGVVVDAGVGPHHAVVYLIADLDHVGSYALALEPGEHRFGVVVERPVEILAAEPLPRRGLELLVGVGPGVAVMEV